MSFSDVLERNFGREPNLQQKEFFKRIERFLLSPVAEQCFILRGYAGTGKTTSIAALVKSLPAFKLNTVLLAPTGRAAKVISNYTGRNAYTIHKQIYRKRSATSPEMAFGKGKNVAENTVFIVDEASMISDVAGDWGADSLLHDLMEYVYNGKNCRLILVGDTAQLPPVGSLESPALNDEYMRASFGIDVFSYELTQVVRQEKESGILENATILRELIRLETKGIPQLSTYSYKDIFKMTGERLVEGLDYAHGKFGIENTLVVCRSNKSANLYNQNIRTRLLYREEELTGGDYIMVVRNNYFWLPEESQNAFIANGDIARVRKVRSTHERYGFRFADVLMEFIDDANAETIECKVMVDTLTEESPNLPYEKNKKLYEAILEDYMHIPNKSKRFEAMKKDPFYNALQIKFAYAVTCHKAQGGQWDAVFIDQGYLTEEMVDTDFLRWLYTAVTRATKELFLVNFNERFYTPDQE